MKLTKISAHYNDYENDYHLSNKSPQDLKLQDLVKFIDIQVNPCCVHNSPCIIGTIIRI